MMLQAARTGAILGGAVAILVVLLAFVTPIARGYPVALLPVLAAGPLVVRAGAYRPLALLARGFVAGLVTAVVVVATLAFSVEVLNARTWTLVGAFSYPPMPKLPT